jgi:hypothetical protein
MVELRIEAWNAHKSKRAAAARTEAELRVVEQERKQEAELLRIKAEAELERARRAPKAPAIEGVATLVLPNGHGNGNGNGRALPDADSSEALGPAWTGAKAEDTRHRVMVAAARMRETGETPSAAKIAEEIGKSKRTVERYLAEE